MPWWWANFNVGGEEVREERYWGVRRDKFAAVVCWEVASFLDPPSNFTSPLWLFFFVLCFIHRTRVEKRGNIEVLSLEQVILRTSNQPELRRRHLISAPLSSIHPWIYPSTIQSLSATAFYLIRKNSNMKGNTQHEIEWQSWTNMKMYIDVHLRKGMFLRAFDGCFKLYNQVTVVGKRRVLFENGWLLFCLCSWSGLKFCGRRITLALDKLVVTSYGIVWHLV